MRESRGIRNNNPLNIKFGKSRWVGKITKEKKDPVFEEFDSMENGLRAAIKLIRNYIKRGYTTVDKIIRRWCPDETQDKYVRYVEEVMRVNFPLYVKTDQILQHDFDKIFVLVSAMAWQESRTKVDKNMFYNAWQAVDTHNRLDREKAVIN